MSSLYKHPPLINSDESNSTEHDATVSLSGTDEFNDTHSVFSDVGSKASKLNDPRKAMHRLNKLKEENAMLKESLEKANATDITMLKSKLRGSHADLVRMRQNNSELKDRIQILEGRLFTALSMSSTNSKSSHFLSDINEKDVGGSGTIDGVPLHFSEPPQKDKFTSGDRAHLMDMIRSLQSRCKHLARLVQSYETKITVMQSEVDAKHSTQPVLHPTSHTALHSIEFELNPPHEVHDVHTDRTNTATLEWTSNPLKSALKGGTQTSYASMTNPNLAQSALTSSETASGNATATKRVKISSSEVESRIRQAREEDQKMIKELSNEVRRLVALLPRDKIDPEDEIRKGEESGGEGNGEGSGSSDEGKGEGSGSSGDEGRVVQTISVGGGKGASTVGKNSKNALLTMHANANKANSIQYTHGDVLCSFILGVVIMLLCVAVSTYLVNQVNITDPETEIHN